MSGDFLPIGETAPFQQVLPKTMAMPLPPRFAFGTVPGEVAAQYYGAMLLSAVGVYDGTGLALSDGFLLHRGERPVVAPDLKIFPTHLNAVPAEREAGFPRRPRRHTPPAALVVSPGHMIYGHWLSDILPRLAVLVAAGHALESLVFPVPHDTPRFGLEMMRLFGIPEANILPYAADEVLAPERLWLPTLLHNGVRYAPLLADAVALFRRGLLRAGHDLSPVDGAPTRVFLTRGKGNRRLLNRPAIEAMAVQAGFTLVAPETMSLPEQFTLFANAREISGEYGSAFHTALFSQPGTVVCGVRGSQNHPGFLQSAMGAVLDQPTGYVFGQTGAQDGEPSKPHDYTVPEQAFADCLRIAFGAFSRQALRPPGPEATATATAPDPSPKPEESPKPGKWTLFRRPARH